MHLTSYEHRAFIRDKSNFESLDALINKVPSTVQFLQSVLLKHCVQKQDVAESSENSVGNFLSVAPPISPLTTERVLSLETVPTSLIVPQELKDETISSKNKQTTDDTESLYPTKTKNDDNRLSAVVIRRPTPSGIFTSPRRRQPTPSKKPWVQERSMVFRDSPMASLQPSIKSSPSITLAESVCLGGTRCFSAPALNKKQELKKSASRSLIRVIDFSQITNIESNKTQLTIDTPSAQFNPLSAGDVKKKLIGNNVSIKLNKRKSHKLRKKEKETVKKNLFQDDIIQDFHFLTLSADEKAIDREANAANDEISSKHFKNTSEREPMVNNNSFSSEHLKDTNEGEANANNNSFSSEHFKDTSEKAANANNSCSYEHDTTEMEAKANNNSFSSEHIKDITEMEVKANDNSFSSEHIKDTTELEAKANDNSFCSEHIKDTTELEAKANDNSFCSEHTKDTTELEAKADNSFSPEHIKDSTEREAKAKNSFSSEHIEDTTVMEANANNSFSSEHFKDTTEREANANNSFSTEHFKDTTKREANVNNSFSSEHFKDTTKREANGNNSFSSEHFKDMTEREANANNSFSSEHFKDMTEREANTNNSFSSEHFKDTTKREANANNSFCAEHFKRTTKSVCLNAIVKVKCSTQTKDQPQERQDNLLVKQQNTVFKIKRELVNDFTLPDVTLSNKITLSKKNKSLSENNKSLHGYVDIVPVISENIGGGSKCIADTSTFMSCRKNVESEAELTSLCTNKMCDLLSQNETDCEVQAPEGDCLNGTPQSKNHVFYEKANGICPFKQVCNISAPMNFNCVVNLGTQLLRNNLLTVTYQNESKAKHPSTNKEMQKECYVRIGDDEYIPNENCLEKLSEEDMSFDCVDYQDGCEINNTSMSVPNIADRVKTRQRINQLVEQSDDEAELSSLNSQNKGGKKRKRNQKSLNKFIENITNDNLAHSDCNNTLETSEQPADLALPAFPNIAERVKKRRSCTLFNHEGQYANSGLNSSGVILSPEMLRLHTDYTHKNNHKMVSISSGTSNFRRKLIFSGNRSTLNVNEDSKMSSDCTQSSPAVVIRRRNPLSCRTRTGTNKDWSKHETDKEHSDNQTSSDSDKKTDNLRDGCDKQAKLASRTENLLVKDFKKKPPNQDVSNESPKKRDQNIASENSLKMNTISYSPRLLLKIKRQTKNTFSSTLEEIDCSSSFFSQLNQAESSQRPETPQPLNRANCLDSDSESIKLFNCSPAFRKKNIYMSPNCNSSSLKASHEKPRRFKKRKRLNFEEISGSSIKSPERSKSPIFSSPAVKNTNLLSTEKQNYFTRSDSPIFCKKQSHNASLNGIGKSNVNLKADLEVKTVKEDFKGTLDVDDNDSEYAQVEDFSSDATYIYDAEGYEVIPIETFDGQNMANSSHEVTGYNNDYKDFLTFIPKQNSPEKTEVSSWGDICDSYINNSIVMNVANSGVRVIKDRCTKSPLKFQSDSNPKKCTMKIVNKSAMSDKKGKRRFSEMNCFDNLVESCKKKVKI